MSNIQIFEQKDFTGGLNLRSDQYQLADNESPEMLNVEVDPRGGIFSRGGMVRFHSAVATTDDWNPQRLYGFYGTTNNLVLINNVKIYKQNSTGFTPIAHSGGDIVSTGVHGASCATWGSNLYIVTGATNTVGSYVWSGAGVATNIPASSSATWQTRSAAVANRMPQAELITVHSNRVFVANTKEDGNLFPNRLRWSDESLPTNWVYNDYIDIEGGGNKITGMCVVNGGLVVFKEYSMYFLYGYDHTDYRIVQIASDIGCVSPHSFVTTQQGVYFYANRKGLHFFDGSNLTNLFEPLRTAFDLRYINTSIPEKVSISWIGRRVWLSLPYSKTGSQETLATINVIYDPSMRSYSMFSTADNYGVVGGIDYRTSEGNEIRLACHPVVKTVLEVDKYDYDYDVININNSISGFSTVYRTKWFDGGSFLQRKMFRRPDLVMRETETNETIAVQVFHDYQEAVGAEKRSFNITLNSSAIGLMWGENWAYEPAGLPTYGSVWSTDVLGGSIKTASNLGMAKTVQLRFVGELTKPWGINSIGYKWVPRRVKG